MNAQKSVGKYILLVTLSSCLLSLHAQFASLEAIPLPPMKLSEADGECYHRRLYRETLSNSYENPELMGEAFREMLVAKRAFRVLGYPEGEDIASCQKVAYQFYQNLLNARSSAGEMREAESYSDIDLRKLKPGGFSEIVFYPSWFGGGIFMWYHYDGHRLHRFSITVGGALMLTEIIYAKEVPLIVPDEAMLGFPVYPGSKFQALESAYFPPSGDMLPLFEILFFTDAGEAEVRQYMDLQMGPSDNILERLSPGVYLKAQTGRDFTEWPRMSVLAQPESYETIRGESIVHPAHTRIVYTIFSRPLYDKLTRN
jgi:hypothetical protein